MTRVKQRERRKTIIFTLIFLTVNFVSIAFLCKREEIAINRALQTNTEETQTQFEEIMLNYERSFQLFAQMMTREIENNPDPDAIWDYLKEIDKPLLEIEGETFDGLYMYYKDRYLYSWDTPYAAYEDTGYVATERPWYKAAVKGQGKIVFTPPYMSYANHYILTTISQLQPDGETVFAYDIKMGDIQALITATHYFKNEQVMIFDYDGTVIGSTEPEYLGGDLYASLEETEQVLKEAENELDAIDQANAEETAKAQDKVTAAEAFLAFRQTFDGGFEKLQEKQGETALLTVNNTKYFGFLLAGEDCQFLTLAPLSSVLRATADIWLVPLLVIELLLIYILSRVTKEQKNRELHSAYIELGQVQKRLEIALSAAQKAAAIDDLTGMMNFKSFRKEMIERLEEMGEEERGILIMLDGDHFKQINDNYGHNVGDEVIKLTAQMIIGRIRTVDIASRLHGDEFAVFISQIADYDVTRRIVVDINASIAKEAKHRNMPSITVSAGAVIAKQGDNYGELSKKADEALYKAKETHDGGFAAYEA